MHVTQEENTLAKNDMGYCGLSREDHIHSTITLNKHTPDVTCVFPDASRWRGNADTSAGHTTSAHPGHGKRNKHLV